MSPGGKTPRLRRGRAGLLSAAAYGHSQIVYVSGADIRTVEADGTHDTLVHRVAEGRPMAPSWSPDGSAIAWQWSPGGGIWRMSSSGRDPPLESLCSAACGGQCRSPTWSPVGNEIAVIADRHGIDLPDAVLLAPATGGQAHDLYTAPGGYAFHDVAWSADGSRLAVSEYQPGDGLDRIRIINRATGGATTVLDGFGDISFLDWARYKEELAFAGTSRSGESGIFTLELQSAAGRWKARPYPVFRTSGSRPSYSPDDSHLVFHRLLPPKRRKSIHAIDLVSGSEQLITNSGMSPDWRRETVTETRGRQGADVGLGRGTIAATTP